MVKQIVGNILGPTRHSCSSKSSFELADGKRLVYIWRNSW